MTGSNKCYNSMTFLDQYEDTVKSRFVFPLVALFLLAYFTFVIIAAAPQVKVLLIS